MSGVHAKLSPSSSKRWFACPGSVVLEGEHPNDANEHSDRGTACHEVAAQCLREYKSALGFVGQWIEVHNEGEEPRSVCITEEMADMVQYEVETVRKLADSAQILLIEQQVDFSQIVGVENQFGTLDVGITTADGELQVRDFKFGFIPVEVEENTQLLIYALATYEQLALSFDITSIRLAIHQPQVAGVTEWTCSVEYLTGEFKTRLKEKVTRVENAIANREHPQWHALYLNPNPNEDECRFCRAMATCPAYRAALEKKVGVGFEDLTSAPVEEIVRRPDLSLTQMMQAVPMLEDLCKAVRAEMECRLLAGEANEAFGLELGRKGPRKFSDPAAAEELLRKQFRLKLEHVYDMSLKSPTQLEKLLKPQLEVDDLSGLTTHTPPVLGERQWRKLQGLITQSDPKPSVKPLKDIKKPYTIPQPDASAFTSVA